MKINIIVVLVLFILLTLPQSSFAYLTTEQTATDLGNGNALFTVTYRFGFLNRELYMPILANRNQIYTDKGTNVAYSILINGKANGIATSSKMTNNDTQVTLNYTLLPGKATAMVLSSAEIKDGQYYLPKGKLGTFTLVAIVDMSKQTTKSDISLLMTSLPFTMVDNGKKIPARLNPSELQYYKTPAVDLKK